MYEFRSRFSWSLLLSEPLMANLLTHICANRPQRVNNKLNRRVNRFTQRVTFVPTIYLIWLLFHAAYKCNAASLIYIFVAASDISRNPSSWHQPPETNYTWWRHQMETFSALLALCAGNSPVPLNSPHKGQWRGALMFSLIYAWINDWVNNREAGDLRRHLVHYDVIVMK